MSAIDVVLSAEWVENVGYRYDVLLDGEVIVARSRDPEYDVARVLHARGLRGRFRTIDFRPGKPRMLLDIEKAAKLRIVERDDGPSRVMRYRPLSDDVRAILSRHTSHQGDVIPGEVAQGTNQSVKRAGGETSVAWRRVRELT
jgi:hypothetical protein